MVSLPVAEVPILPCTQEITNNMDRHYILIWNGLAGKVLADSAVLFDIDVKPSFTFQYQQIFLDTSQGDAYLLIAVPKALPSDVQTYMNIPLTQEQVNECKQYCDSFLDTQDYLVHAYDDEYIYRGNILRSAAQSSGLKFSITEAPLIAYSKFVPSTSKWEPIIVIFKEDGYPIFDQEVPMDSDVLSMTATEWEMLPKQPSAVFSLNFVTMTWEDKRELDRVKYDSIMDVRIYFEHQEIRTGAGKINQSEQSTYVGQHEEAVAYLKDTGANTPFIDGFLSVNPGQDKKSLCERIVADYTTEAKFALGQKHGELYNYIYRIKACKENFEVDDIIREVYEKYGKHRFLNVYRRYPANFAKSVAVGTSMAIFTGGGIYHAR